MNIEQLTNNNAETPLAESFRKWFPLVLSVVEEIQPLVQLNADQREILSLASMELRDLLLRNPNASRRELRRDLERYLVNSFAVALPEEESKPEHLRAAPVDDELKGSRVLIVDDSPMALRQIQFFLEREGYHVFQAKSGEEALWLVGEVDPDLILMDVSMDGMSGFDACRRITGTAENQDLPVIFLSAKGERAEVVKGLSCGAVDYIVKPFHPAESLTRIHTHLRVRKLSKLKEKYIAQLRQINEAKDRVLRAASHDLRNPIGAIAGLASFLTDSSDNLTPTQREITQSMEEAAKGVVDLLNELLDTSALAGNEASPQLGEVDGVKLVGNVLRMFHAEADRKDIRLNCDTELESLRVLADRGQIRRVIDNLVSNAIKFTPIGGSVTVHIDTIENQHSWTLRVEDSGPGVPEAEQNQLFKEFGKTSAVPTGGEKSTGLGLSICKRIINAHGGEISFNNLAGGGACFSITLPTGSGS